ncbi:MAG: hypothetical protein RL091_3688 [Verrucomicrobiota bacterium]|jgi:hypothetical protein
MNSFDHHWQKLTALARQAPADRDILMPPGFATRVAARALAAPAAGPWFMLERFALRGFVAAAACCAAAVVFSYFDRTADLTEETAGVDVAVVALFDLS